MAKQFFYVMLGMFLLVVTYQIGAGRARAEWDPTLPGSIIGLTCAGPNGEGLVYTSTGEAWSINVLASWARDSWVEAFDLPVPASEVKFLDTCFTNVYLITTNDEAWVLNPAINGGAWTSAGAFPGGPVAVKRQSFGKTKATHR